MQQSSFLSGFGRFLESKTTGRFLNFVLIPLLLILALLLPPIELGQRLQTIGYTLISPTQGELRDPDGTRVIVPADGLVAGARTYLKFFSVPRADFERGDTEEALRQAAAALPGHLRPRSPVYRLDLRGTAPTRVVVTIPIPNDSLPYETLDVYNWNGERWEWLPNRLIPEEEVLESDLPFLPTAFTVVQTAPLLPTVGVGSHVGRPCPPKPRRLPPSSSPPCSPCAGTGAWMASWTCRPPPAPRTKPSPRCATTNLARSPAPICWRTC